jgi:hypothetical protein
VTKEREVPGEFVLPEGLGVKVEGDEQEGEEAAHGLKLRRILHVGATINGV